MAQTTKGADPDDIPERPPPRATSGELWVLGPHQLLCADATDHASYEHLLGDERAAMVWTDPPYGVDYEGKTKEALTIQNDGLAPEAHEDFLYDAFSLALGRCRDGAVWYVTAPSSPPHVEPFVSALGRLEIWQQTLVWVKDSFVLGRSDFHYRHELMLYGWAGGRHSGPRAGAGPRRGEGWRGFARDGAGMDQAQTASIRGHHDLLGAGQSSAVTLALNAPVKQVSLSRAIQQLDDAPRPPHRRVEVPAPVSRRLRAVGLLSLPS